MRHTIEVRPAAAPERDAVLNVLDGAMLETDRGRVCDAIDRGDVLVACDDGWIVGALVLDEGHVEAIAVRGRRRASGVGSALIRAAAARSGPLTADFDDRVRPFYESLGFSIEERADGRFRGKLADGGRTE